MTEPGAEPAEGTLIEAAADSSPLDPSSAVVRIAEALLFASDTPVSLRQLAAALPGEAEPEAVVATLAALYAGRGVELVEVAGGWQFRTAADLAPLLRRRVVVPKRLSRAALETLATIAYHQPVTRAEVEEIRGVALAQGVLDALLEAGLIEPRGRRESPGRPALWGTTEGFLRQFGLARIEDLPRAQDLPGVSLPLEAPVAGAGEDAPAEATPAPERAGQSAKGSEPASTREPEAGADPSGPRVTEEAQEREGDSATAPEAGDAIAAAGSAEPASDPAEPGEVRVGHRA